MKPLDLLLILGLSAGAASCGSQTNEPSPEAVERRGPTVDERLKALASADKVLTSISAALVDSQRLFKATESTQAGSSKLVDVVLIQQVLEQARAQVPSVENGQLVTRVALKEIGTGLMSGEVIIQTTDDTEQIDVRLRDFDGSSKPLLHVLQTKTEMKLGFESAALVESALNSLGTAVSPTCQITTTRERVIECAQVPLKLATGVQLVIKRARLSLFEGKAIEIELEPTP